jgi:predicted esterase
MITRRRFGLVTAGALASAAFGGACTRLVPDLGEAGYGRFTARPGGGPTASERRTGALGLAADRDAYFQAPAKPDAAIPLLVLLHGAGGSGDDFLGWLGPAADAAGIAVLSPSSRRSTWDAVRGGFGRDVVFINLALERVFETTAIDPDRVAIGGFSDGATCAIALGLINGDLFRRVVAFSPGFVIDGPPNGKARFYVSHGKADNILPINRCSRVIVPGLRQRGYDVTYREFDGGHGVPDEIAADGFNWAAKL